MNGLSVWRALVGAGGAVLTLVGFAAPMYVSGISWAWWAFGCCVLGIPTGAALLAWAFELTPEHELDEGGES